MKWSKGSEWRKWDLHVHSPASHQFSGDWNGYIIQLGNADCDVIGINDYFSVAGYKEVLRRLNDPASNEGNKGYRDALERLRSKTLIPVLECRMNNVVVDKKFKAGARINFHLIFDPQLPVDTIETFIKGLKVNNASIAARYADAAFLRDEVSVNFSEVRTALASDETFRDRYLIWFPYDEYGGLDNIDPKTDKLFKQGLVFQADILGSSNRAQADFFLWKGGKYTEVEFREWFGKRKACIKGSDSHNVNDEIGKLKDRDSNPTDKYCWIKADPTFTGLKQIVNEPEDRVYIGKLPSKSKLVAENKTQYISRVRIYQPTPSADVDTWFDCEIPINTDMVAIIGNKGSGKSALADVIALAGNTHCEPEYFSFLTKDRFCERGGRIAKNFAAEITWEDGTASTRSLNAKPELNDVERVKYIPQSYLEKVCTETAPGQQSAFQKELRKVIFSHISEADQLGKESLDDLIAYKSEELNQKIRAERQVISQLNAELVKLEAKSTPDYAAQIQSKLLFKRQELESHTASTPPAVPLPANLPPEQQEALAHTLAELDKERAARATIDAEIETQREQQKQVSDKIAVAVKLEGRLENLQAEVDRAKKEYAEDFGKIGVDVNAAITLTINKTLIQTKRNEYQATKAVVDGKLSAADDSLISNKAALEARVKALQDNLDAPNKRYQAYQAALATWQQRMNAIKGSADTPDTVQYYEAQLKYLKDELPNEITSIEDQRNKAARTLHASIAAIRDVYKQLFDSVQGLIESSIIIKEGFKLSFDSSIIERTFERDFFESYANQAVAGSFCRKEQGSERFEQIRAEFDFNNADDAINFVEAIFTQLRNDMRSIQQPRMMISSQLRKNVTVQQLYDYLWSFSYLEPEYSLKLDGKDLSLLSPGERGTLLLVFYLLVDRSNKPIIVDQPEENLDSHTVFRLLIPVIKEVKKRRQIIMVTHSPNIAVVCDAEQIIHSFIDRADRNRVRYSLGSIESPHINKYLVDVLEGTRPAFDNRDSKYYAD